MKNQINERLHSYKGNIMRHYLRKFKRLLKLLVGKDLIIRPNYKCKSIRLGSEYGGWNIIPNDFDKNLIVYSFGVGEDVSFDIALIEKFGIIVHAFDPTPRSISWCKNQNLSSNFILHEYGIADFDGIILFNPPENPNYISHTILERSTKDKAIEVPVKKLTTLMKELGHDNIDVLKMDIEGAEYSVIKDMKTSNIRPNQLLIEFHHRFPNVGISKTKDTINEIKNMGYRIFWVSESGEEYGFVLKNI